MCDECIAECCFHVVFRCLLTGIILVVDWLVIRRKAFIVHHGRRIQDFLRLPEPLHTFAKTDPGIQDLQLQRSSHVLVFIWLSQAFSLLTACITRKVWCLVVLVPGIVIPGFLFCPLYLWLVVSRRKLSATQRLHARRCLQSPEKGETERIRLTTPGNDHEDSFRALEPVLSIIWAAESQNTL